MPRPGHRIMFVAGWALSLAGLAQAQAFETGWLADQQGAVDPGTRTRVVVAASLNGAQAPDGTMKWAGRYVSLEIPRAALDLRRLAVIGEDGRPLPHKHPEAFAGTTAQGERVMYLKLFMDRPPGFKFKVRLD